MNDIQEIIFQPQPGGQQEFLKKIYVDEVLFGGAAGPGKSWALVFDALGTQYQFTPLGKPAYECSDYRAALFRRQTTQFSKLIDEGNKLYTRLGADYIAQRRGDPGPSFNFKSGFVSGVGYTGQIGARIFICHMSEEKNKEDHQGIEYQYAGFDELTQFTVTQYTYILSRLRTTIEHLNARMRGTTNPTGSGLVWVKKRFIKNGALVLEQGKVHHFNPDPENSIEDNPTGVLAERRGVMSKSRMFIPGLLLENKVLMKTDPTYQYNIMAMGKKYEKALLHGDWDAFGGEFFDDYSTDMNVEPFDIPQDWFLLGSIDPGWSSPCSFGLHAVSQEGKKYRLFTYYEKKLAPYEHAKNIKKKIKEFPYTHGRMPDIIVSGTDAFAKKEKFAIQANETTFSDVFESYGLHLTPAKTDRALGWMTMKSLMRRGKWFLFKDYNNQGVEEIVAAEHDENDPEDIKGRGNSIEVSDHFLDEERYSCMSAIVPALQVESSLPDWYEKEMDDDTENYSSMGV